MDVDPCGQLVPDRLEEQRHRPVRIVRDREDDGDRGLRVEEDDLLEFAPRVPAEPACERPVEVVEIAELVRVCTRVAPQARGDGAPVAGLGEGHGAASVPAPRFRFPLVAVGKTVIVRAVVQRVSGAGVRVEGETVAEIGPGLLVLLGVAGSDVEGDADRLAGKVARLRIFESEAGKLDRSLLESGGAALVVSQFTLLADSKRQKGTRPDFSKAARPEIAEPIYDQFCEALRALGVTVRAGVFGARMEVELVNEGPVTIVLDVGKWPP